jgi:hypothetical protein
VTPERVDVVVPAVRGDLVARLLGALGVTVEGPPPAPLGDVVVVWDSAAPGRSGAGARVVRGPQRGPAAARNAGWRTTRTPWIAFLDDDVVPAPDWRARLADDIARAAPDVAGVQGRVAVPLPAGRPPTDWERNVARLADTPGIITADLVCRRAAVEQVGGFDERFTRAYREDTDFELRLIDAGWRLEQGTRTIEHPVRAAPALVSARLQRGNADDVLLWALHGARSGVTWRTKARYAALTAALLSRRRAGLALWAAGTAHFGWSRVRGGPRTPRELAAMAVTSAAIPPLAVLHTLAGAVRHRALVLARLRS